MKQLFVNILILFISVALIQCSSVRRTGVAVVEGDRPIVEREAKKRDVVPPADVQAKADSLINEIVALKDTIEQKKLIEQLDSLALDSELDLGVDSVNIFTEQLDSAMTADTVKIDTKEKLDATVVYTAKDSIVFTKDNMGYLYGDADVKYGDLSITGENIIANLDSSLISATFGLDSIGKEFGYPVFNQGGSEYEMKRVKYNFETGKAYINNVITQEGEGHIVANTAKKNADNSFYMVNAKYTTCDLHDHPHFYINLSKAKVRPGKDVVTGPAWLVVADVPLFPVVLPFAFFPFTDSYSSGIIMPSYGDEMERGFYLHNGGYYFAINDYVDLALTGEIYTKGSWGVSGRSNYRKRYKFSGNVNANYLSTVIGDRELKDMGIPGAYSESKD